MSKGKKESENDKDLRRIKQVYVSEDGNEEETVLATRRIDKNEEEETEHRPHHEQPHHEQPMREPDHHHAHKVSGAGRAVRAVAIAVAMIFSLVLAMAGGAYLALWDSGRTAADLHAILLGREVAAATSEAETTEATVSEQDMPENTADAGTDTAESSETDSTKEPGDEPGQEPDEAEAPSNDDETSDEEGTGEGLDTEAQWDEPSGYGSTIISDEDGSESVEKAGSEDEITKEEEEEDDSDPSDPMQDYPLPFTTVDESYFTDALFIGDSRLQGFGFWSGLPATYYCATGFQLYKYETANIVQTENGKVPIFEAIPYDAFTKIYIKVGLNELGYGTEENFEKYYAQLIAQLREYEPRAIIYVHGLLPVTAEKSASDKAHNNPNITMRNEALKKFAEKEKAYYLDAGPYLSTEDGSLRPEMTTDGIHLSAQYMKIWRDYLCEHAIVIK